MEGDRTRVRTAANEENDMELVKGAVEHYRFGLGTGPDCRFVRKWYSGETRQNEGNSFSFRWSHGISEFVLPVVPHKEYQMQLSIMVPKNAVIVPESTGIFMNDKRLSPVFNEGEQHIMVTIPPQINDVVTLQLRSNGWVPKNTDKGSKDYRELGVQGMEVIMKAKDTAIPLYNVQ